MGPAETLSQPIQYDLHWSREREASLLAGDERSLLLPSNRRLFRRWLEAGLGEWMVPRSAFDIVDFAELVGSLCVYDRDEARDDYLCRVFGGSVAEDIGVDMTGRYLSSYPEPVHAVIRAQYDRVAASRRPLVAIYRVAQVERSDLYPREHGRFLHEKLILPVTRSGRAIDCFITHVGRLPADARPAGPHAAGDRPADTAP